MYRNYNGWQTLKLEDENTTYRRSYTYIRHIMICYVIPFMFFLGFILYITLKSFGIGIGYNNEEHTTLLPNETPD